MKKHHVKVLIRPGAKISILWIHIKLTLGVKNITRRI